MSFAANFAAESTEYIVIGAILVLILALAFVTLFNTLQQKLLDVNSSL
jgi:ABC-type proline/glycine betaine transport system permease subunit